MRMSKLFFQTLREVPSDADTVSHQLMLRAGMIHQIAAGIFDLLPTAQRIKHKIEDIIREEMDAIDGQEVTLPMVHPVQLHWPESGASHTLTPQGGRIAVPVQASLGVLVE